MFTSAFPNLKKTTILLALASIVFYTLFAYDLVRAEHTKLILLYTALFLLFYKLVCNTTVNFKFLAVLAILFRVLFLFATPNLSQDFYRFIWDGRMILEGFNPYLFTPESFISIGKFPVAQAQELYQNMGTLNGSHFTNYPPIKQFIFMVAAVVFGKSVLGAAIVFRVFIIMADIGTLFIGKKLLEHFKLPIHHIFLYILNPFIIIELTGNLHFEGIMIFFLVLSLYLLCLGKWKVSAVLFGISVSVKLVPLLFLPLFFQYFIGRKKQIHMPGRSKKHTFLSTYKFNQLLGFYAIVAVTTLILFAPFYSSEFVENYSKTVGLWFGNFEFNASLYYVAREIGYWLTGYNQIGIIGNFIPILTILAILMLTFWRNNTTVKQLMANMLFALSIYYFISTTVHPWYLATLLILSVFTKYRFPLVWSFMIIFSYLAYANAETTENLWIISLEYLVVYSVFIWEVFIKKDPEKEVLLS